MTPKQVARELEKREQREGRSIMVIPRFKRSPNRGNGSCRNFTPNPTNGWDLMSTHLHRGVNAEGNEAVIPISAKVSDRDWVDTSKLDPDERKIRRMKNSMRRLHRSWKNRRKHGRTVHVAH